MSAPEKPSAEAVLSSWWNDTMRKDWRMALEDPGERNSRLLDLAAIIQREVVAPLEQRIAELEEALRNALEALAAARDVIATEAKECSRTPLGYSATMTESELRMARAVADLDILRVNLATALRATEGGRE